MYEGHLRVLLLYDNDDSTIAFTVVLKSNSAANYIDVVGDALYSRQGHSPPICGTTAIVLRKCGEKWGRHADAIKFGAAVDETIRRLRLC